MDPYPVEEGRDASERIRFNLRAFKDKLDEVKLIAVYWRELDNALGVKRKRVWEPNSVIERFIDIGIDLFWHQVGGRPTEAEDRDEFLKRAVAFLKSKQSQNRK